MYWCSTEPKPKYQQEDPKRDLKDEIRELSYKFDKNLHELKRQQEDQNREVTSVLKVMLICELILISSHIVGYHVGESLVKLNSVVHHFLLRVERFCVNRFIMNGSP